MLHTDAAFRKPREIRRHDETVSEKSSAVGRSGPTVPQCSTAITALLSLVPGRFSSELGLDLSTRRPRDLFLWFLAAILYGARISGSIVVKTHAEFVRRDLTSPDRIVNIGWDGLVKALDGGGYVRYDFKTATKLLDVMNNLISRYGGDLETLHDAAADPRDLETRLKSLGKGIGDVTVQIFLRELRDIWPKAQPTLSPLSILAGRDLGLFSTDRGGARITVDQLRTLWKQAGVKDKSFRDFESALVRLGRDYCRRRTPTCPMRAFCA
jgi:endonuclease III